MTIIGRLLLAEGRPQAAKEAFHQAITLCDQTAGPENVGVAGALIGAAEAEIALGRSAEAEALVTRALALGLRSANQAIVAGALFARALARAATAPIEALTFAKEARDAYAQAGLTPPERRARRVEIWIERAEGKRILGLDAEDANR